MTRLLRVCLILTSVLFAAPLFAQGLPDLIVDQASLRQHWVVRTEDFPSTFCSVQEGAVNPGAHQVVRFTVSTPNIGTADLSVGDPNAHIAANDGLFEFASCHNHFHFRHYALYQLIDPNTGYIRLADANATQVFSPGNNDQPSVAGRRAEG